jgi:hypothetical protein
LDSQVIQAKTQKELLLIIGVLTFLLSSVLNNLTVATGQLQQPKRDIFFRGKGQKDEGMEIATFLLRFFKGMSYNMLRQNYSPS